MNLSRASLISTIAAVITTNFVYAEECQDVEGWRSLDDFGCDWEVIKRQVVFFFWLY